jgi:hypothetical protein
MVSTERDLVRTPGRRVEQPSDIEEEDDRITKLHQNLYRAGDPYLKTQERKRRSRTTRLRHQAYLGPGSSVTKKQMNELLRFTRTCIERVS